MPSSPSTLLQTCRCLHHLRQLHAHLLRRNQISDPFTTTKLLETYLSFNSTTAALRLLNSTPNAPVHMWAAVLRSLVDADDPHQAIHYYTRMRSLSVEPYKFAFLYAIKAFTMVGASQHGRAIHANVIKTRLDYDIYVRSSMVSFYSGCGRLEDALHVFREVPSDNNAVIWNAAISGCFANGDVGNAERVFGEMPHRDVRTWNLVVGGYSKCGMVDLAREVFDGMPERDLRSWSAMVGGYVSSGRAAEGLSLFDDMVCSGVKPDGVTVSTAFAACAQTGALDTGKWLHAYLKKNRLRQDVVLGTSLVDMYAKCGCVDLALQVFRGMEYKNVSSWNAMICGLALNGRGGDALALFGEMEQVSVVPNDITFVGVLSACGHIGKVGEGCELFERMRKDFKIDPKIEHYGCMVDLFARAGLVSDAGKLIASMPKELNPVVLGSFLSACATRGDANASEEVMRELSRLDPGDGGCHLLISNIYASKNQWDGVARTRELLKGKGFRKVPGCSSIEVNSLVHEFAVADQTHPCWEEIYGVIGTLSTHLETEGYVLDSLLVLYDMEDVD